MLDLLLTLKLHRRRIVLGNVLSGVLIDLMCTYDNLLSCNQYKSKTLLLGRKRAKQKPCVLTIVIVIVHI